MQFMGNTTKPTAKATKAKIIQGASVRATKTNPARVELYGIGFTSETPRSPERAEAINAALDKLEADEK